MKRNMMSRILSAVAALTLVAGSTATLTNAQSGYSVRIENESDYAIHQIHLSPVSDTDWERDLLGPRRTLPSGWYFTFNGVMPGRYDLKLIDEDGDVCVVSNVRISGNTNWGINNSWLLNCEFH